MSDRTRLTDYVPCPACGAWAGEPCTALYTKDGGKTELGAGKPVAGHHMARCMLWHTIRGLRGETSAGSHLRRGTVIGCYYDAMEIVRTPPTTLHTTRRDVERWQTENLMRAVRRA